MSVEFDRGSPGKFDSRTLNRKTLNRWTGRSLFVQTGHAQSEHLLNARDLKGLTILHPGCVLCITSVITMVANEMYTPHILGPPALTPLGNPCDLSASLPLPLPPLSLSLYIYIYTYTYTYDIKLIYVIRYCVYHALCVSHASVLYMCVCCI